MRRLVAHVCALGLIGTSLALAAPLAQAEPAPAPAAQPEQVGPPEQLFADVAGDAVGDTYIVKFADNADRGAQVRGAVAEGVTIKRELTHVFPGLIIQATAAQAEKIAGTAGVESVTLDTPVTGSEEIVLTDDIASDEEMPAVEEASEDEASGDEVTGDAVQNVASLWGLDRIDQRNLPLNQRYQYSTTASNVTVYVLDSGIRATHTEYVGRVLPGATAVDNTVNDCHGHGTHVAGTIGGKTYGVAKGVKIVPVRVLDCDNSGWSSWTIAGIDWVVGHHQAGTPAVANLSLGGPANSASNDAIARLTRDGVTTVVSAGNETTNACTKSPASAPSAITVAASTPADQQASFSNYGSCVDIYAPGTDILSSMIGSDTNAARWSGTSMASPHVAGVAALILARSPKLTPAQVTTQIVNSSTKSKIRNASANTPNRLLFSDGRTPVRAKAPTFRDLCGTSADRYTIPTTKGVIYGVNGSTKAAGTYAASGTIRVTARAASGYRLTGATTWSKTFTRGSSFRDVSSTTQFYREICWMSTSRISTGYPDGTYRPTQPVNRDAMAAFMYRLAGSPKFTPPSRSPFKDVTPQTQFYKEITWLASKKISTGYPDGTFRPTQPVNRDAMAAFMYRLAGSPRFTPPSRSPFRDVTPRTQFYKEITWLASKKITTGYPDRTFRPTQPVNRDAMAAFMYRLKVVNKLV